MIQPKRGTEWAKTTESETFRDPPLYNPPKTSKKGSGSRSWKDQIQHHPTSHRSSGRPNRNPKPGPTTISGLDESLAEDYLEEIEGGGCDGVTNEVTQKPPPFGFAAKPRKEKYLWREAKWGEGRISVRCRRPYADQFISASLNYGGLGQKTGAVFRGKSVIYLTILSI